MAKAIQKAKIIPAEKTGGNRSYRFLYEGIVFLFAFLLFANSISNDYNLDDELVTRNHRLTSKGISAIPEIFTSPYYEDMSGYSYEYRPIVLVSFAIEHEFFGDDAQWSHFINVFLYALTCLILFRVLRLLFKGYSPLLSAAICLLYAAHPAHTEVVCSIKNRDEILGLLFSFLAMYSAIKVVNKRKWWMFAVTFLCFVLGLLSKVTVVSFTVIIPLALLLFTDINSTWLVSLTLLLAVPACFFMNLGGAIERVKILTIILTAVLLLYFRFHQSFQFQALRDLMGNTYKRTFQSRAESVGYNLKDLFQNIFPERNFWSFRSFIFTVLLGLLYLYTIWLGHAVIALVPMAILILLAWRGEDNIAWWASVMIGFCFTAGLAVMAISAVRSDRDEWYREILCLYFGYQLFYGKKGLLVPTLICWIVTNYLMISPAQNHNINGLFSLFMVFLVYKYARLLIVIIAIAGNTFNIYKGGANFLGVLSLCASLFVVSSIHLNRYRKLVTPVLATILVVFFYFFQTEQISKMPLQIAVLNMDKNLKPPTISKPQNRPLTYIEEVVTMTTPISVRIGTALEVLIIYLQKVIVPYPLSFYYGYKFIYPQNLTDFAAILSLMIYSGLAIFSFLFLRRYTLLSFGIITYLVSIAIFSNYYQPVPGMIADRFLLVPSLGWIVILIAVLQILFRIAPGVTSPKDKDLPATAKSVFIVILIFYSGITFARNFDWKDDITLFRHDISYVERSAQAHNLLALHIMQNTQQETDPNKRIEMEREALVHFKKSQDIYPKFFNTAYDIGRVYTLLNMQDSAIAAFKYSLTMDTSLSDAYLSLGSLLMNQSKYAEAIPYLKSVLRIVPDQYIGYDKLSYSYFQMHEMDKSIEVNKVAIKLVKNNADPYLNIARVYIANGQNDSATIYLKTADKIAPGNPVIQQLMQQTVKH